MEPAYTLTTGLQRDLIGQVQYHDKVQQECEMSKQKHRFPNMISFPSILQCWGKPGLEGKRSKSLSGVIKVNVVAGGAAGFFFLVDPVVRAGLPAHQLLWLEPQADLLLGTLYRVTAVADVPADLDAEIPSDGAWFGLSGVGLTQHHSASFHCTLALPNHGNYWARVHVVDEACEEWSVLKVIVVLLQELFRGVCHFQAHEFEALHLEPLDDLSHESPVDSIRLDGDEGAFLVPRHDSS